MRYDLHVHSNVSDGAFPPTEVVRRAREAGLDGIALTDHDSTAGLDDARAAAAGALELLTGCEVSSRWGSIGVHMLAYFVDVDNRQWSEALEWIRDDRVVRAKGMVEKLSALGVPITFEQVQAIAQGPSIGRPHIAQALVDLGVVPTTPDAFTPEWIGDGGRGYVAKKVASPHETVKLIADAGGVSAIAHPVWVEREANDAGADGWAVTEGLVEELAALGLTGLEVNHPDLDGEMRARYGKLAERHGLIQTASSDWHGNMHGGVLGENFVGEDVVAALRARATNPQKEQV